MSGPGRSGKLPARHLADGSAPPLPRHRHTGWRPAETSGSGYAGLLAHLAAHADAEQARGRPAVRAAHRRPWRLAGLAALSGAALNDPCTASGHQIRAMEQNPWRRTSLTDAPHLPNGPRTAGLVHGGSPDLSSHTPDSWRQTAIYQVYPRSFADADGDGLGDLKGITQRLGQLATLGVDALVAEVWRS